MLPLATKQCRILCLHGYGQNAEVFRRSTAVLRKALQKHRVELVYLDAPHEFKTPTQNVSDSPPRRELRWWESQVVNATDGQQQLSYSGCKESLEYLATTLGHFDGVLGFSQGAAMASLMMALGERTDLKFGIFIGGFACRDVEYGLEVLKLKPIQSRSLHVIGLADEWVTPDRSRQLVDLFASPAVLEHSGGHFCPQDSENKRKIVDFILENNF